MILLASGLFGIINHYIPTRALSSVVEIIKIMFGEFDKSTLK